MAAAPRWKVYDRYGEYIAACKYPEHAAAILGALGEGTELRSGHNRSRVVWIEGDEILAAGESCDTVADTAYTRILTGRFPRRWADRREPRQYADGYDVTSKA